MRVIEGIGNWVLVVMAAASLMSMIAAFRLDMIINQDLYSYGLQFSHGWAFPYWDTIRTIFAMAWLNIIVAIAFQIYRIRIIRQAEEKSSNKQVENITRKIGEQKNMDLKVAEKELGECTTATVQTASCETKDEVQIIPYEPPNCEQTESKATEQADGQKETKTDDSKEEKTSQEETQSEEPEEPQVTIRWATDESESGEESSLETGPL
jgi:hypothetical protein